VYNVLLFKKIYERKSKMARIGITREQVFQAAEYIRDAGETPTIDRVRAQLGNTGSPNTIHKHLKLWKLSQPQVHRKTPELPADLAIALIQEIEKQAAAARAEAEGEATESDATADRLAEAGELLEAEADQLRELNAELETARGIATAEATARAEQIKTLKQQCEKDQVAAETARQNTVKAQYTVDAQEKQLMKLETDLAAALEKLEKEREKTATAVREAAVAVGKCEAETRRADDAIELGIQSGMRDLDTINELKKDLLESRKEAREAEKMKDRARNDALKYQTQLNSEIKARTGDAEKTENEAAK
jgi:colicin import membrane protein